MVMKYMTDILRYIEDSSDNYWKALLSFRGLLEHFDAFSLRLVGNLLNNKTIILLNLAV